MPLNKLKPIHSMIWFAIVCFPMSGLLHSSEYPVPDNIKITPSFGAWITYWDFKRGVETIAHNPAVFTDIFLFSAMLDSMGKPILSNNTVYDQDTIRQLRQKSSRLWLTLVNDVKNDKNPSVLKDPNTIHALLFDAKRRKQHCQDILNLALELGVDGIDIDYENLWYDDRALFTQFIKELAEQLQQHNIKLSLTVQPKHRELISQGAGAMDWAALCPQVDRLQIMLYNLHNGKTAPGAMATSDWIKKVSQFAQTKCNQSKLVPVLKVSGMHWQPEKTKGIQYTDVQKLLQNSATHQLRQALNTGGAPYFKFDKNHHQHSVYYEDTESLLQKTKLLNSLGYNHVVFWSLGRQDPELPQGLYRHISDSTGAHHLRNL